MKPSLLKHTWKDFSQKLENLLLDHTESAAIPLQRQYELQVDFSGMFRHLSEAPQDPVEKVVYIFKELHHYFESGLLLENTSQNYNTIAHFHKNQIQIAGEQLHKISIKLPTTHALQILSTNSQVFMKKLHLNWDPDNRCRAYLVKPTSEFAYILFSPVPDLWMQNEIPKMAKSFEMIFSS